MALTEACTWANGRDRAPASAPSRPSEPRGGREANVQAPVAHFLHPDPKPQVGTIPALTIYQALLGVFFCVAPTSHEQRKQQPPVDTIVTPSCGSRSSHVACGNSPSTGRAGTVGTAKAGCVHGPAGVSTGPDGALPSLGPSPLPTHTSPGPKVGSPRCPYTGHPQESGQALPGKGSWPRPVALRRWCPDGWGEGRGHVAPRAGQCLTDQFFHRLSSIPEDHCAKALWPSLDTQSRAKWVPHPRLCLAQKARSSGLRREVDYG